MTAEDIYNFEHAVLSISGVTNFTKFLLTWF